MTRSLNPVLERDAPRPDPPAARGSGPAPTDPAHDEESGVGRAVLVDRFVAQRIRQRRRACGLNQRQFAEALGVSLQQVHKYETGANRVSAGRLAIMAETLGVAVSYFYPEVSDTAERSGTVRGEPALARDIAALRDPAHRAVIESVCRVLLDHEQSQDPAASARNVGAE